MKVPTGVEWGVCPRLAGRGWLIPGGCVVGLLGRVSAGMGALLVIVLCV